MNPKALIPRNHHKLVTAMNRTNRHSVIPKTRKMYFNDVVNWELGFIATIRIAMAYTNASPRKRLKATLCSLITFVSEP
uniref:Uncharacterized protein n=1 Tax=Ficus carica TaxID=3494 RepID=A0AA88E905_FICCA|nr:hypothetical protein TIFTF001_038529 [Ficus carica]GMN69487.1 hypothetical protein TIFTF001_038538 [Ficus carica]